MLINNFGFVEIDIFPTTKGVDMFPSTYDIMKLTWKTICMTKVAMRKKMEWDQMSCIVLTLKIITVKPPEMSNGFL